LRNNKKILYEVQVFLWKVLVIEKNIGGFNPLSTGNISGVKALSLLKRIRRLSVKLAEFKRNAFDTSQYSEKICKANFLCYNSKKYQNKKLFNYILFIKTRPSPTQPNPT